MVEVFDTPVPVRHDNPGGCPTNWWTLVRCADAAEPPRDVDGTPAGDAADARGGGARVAALGTGGIANPTRTTCYLAADLQLGCRSHGATGVTGRSSNPAWPPPPPVTAREQLP